MGLLSFIWSGWELSGLPNTDLDAKWFEFWENWVTWNSDLSIISVEYSRLCFSILGGPSCICWPILFETSDCFRSWYKPLNARTLFLALKAEIFEVIELCLNVWSVVPPKPAVYIVSLFNPSMSLWSIELCPGWVCIFEEIWGSWCEFLFDVRSWSLMLPAEFWSRKKLKHSAV